MGRRSVESPEAAGSADGRVLVLLLRCRTGEMVLVGLLFGGPWFLGKPESLRAELATIPSSLSGQARCFSLELSSDCTDATK